MSDGEIEDSGLHDFPVEFQGSIRDDGEYVCFDGKPCKREAEWGHPCGRDIAGRLECERGLAVLRQADQ